jgi:hypothetical protein
MICAVDLFAGMNHANAYLVASNSRGFTVIDDASDDQVPRATAAVIRYLERLFIAPTPRFR